MDTATHKGKGKDLLLSLSNLGNEAEATKKIYRTGVKEVIFRGRDCFLLFALSYQDTQSCFAS